MRRLLVAYRRQNETELDALQTGRRTSMRSAEEKARAFGEAILRTAEPHHLPLLRICLDKVSLTPSAELLTLTTLRLGEPQDVENLGHRLCREDQEIRYWHQIEIALAVEDCVARSKLPAGRWMSTWMDWDGFWGQDAGSSDASGGPMKLTNRDNRLLLVRIVGHALIGGSGTDEVARLERLATHPYRMIARRAALRLAAIDVPRSWERLRRLAGEGVKREVVRSASVALRDAEVHLLGLLDLSR